METTETTGKIMLVHGKKRVENLLQIIEDYLAIFC